MENENSCISANNISVLKLENNFEDVLEFGKEILKANPEFDESFVLINLSEIIRRYHAMGKLLPRVQRYFAMKSNPLPTVIKVLASLNCNFDCASKGEIQLALKYNVKPNQIIFANPVKAVAELKYAAEFDVSKMTFDTPDELINISKHYPTAKCLLRIACDSSRTIITLGKKFGCNPETEAETLLGIAKRLGINVIGIAFHVGVGCLEPEAYERALKHCKDLYLYGKMIGYNFAMVDIGGGFPGEAGFDYTQLAATINNCLDTYFPKHTYPNLEVISEFGQYYVGASGFTFCPIYAKRCEIENDENILNYYINESLFNSFVGRIDFGKHFSKPNIWNKENLTNKDLKRSFIKGCSSDKNDVIFKDLMLPELDAGDWLYWMNMGSYTVARGRHFNCSNPPLTFYLIDYKCYNNLVENESGLFKESDFYILA